MRAFGGGCGAARTRDIWATNAAAAAPARILTLAISDVPGDDPAVIASGPTVPDPTSFADARAVLAKYRITPPDAVSAHLAAAAEETPKPGDPIFARTRFEMIASPQQALAAIFTLAGEESVREVRVEGQRIYQAGERAA